MENDPETQKIVQQLEESFEDAPVVPQVDVGNSTLTQEEADEVLNSQQLLQTLRESDEGEGAKAQPKAKPPETWILASCSIFLIYLFLVFFVE